MLRKNTVRDAYTKEGKDTKKRILERKMNKHLTKEIKCETMSIRYYGRYNHTNKLRLPDEGIPMPRFMSTIIAIQEVLNLAWAILVHKKRIVSCVGKARPGQWTEQSVTSNEKLRQLIIPGQPFPEPLTGHRTCWGASDSSNTIPLNPLLRKGETLSYSNLFPRTTSC